MTTMSALNTYKFSSALDNRYISTTIPMLWF